MHADFAVRLKVALLVAACAVGAGAANADNGPVIVVPGKPGVPVLLHGYDVSGAVVEGDWGLYRPGSSPTIVSGPFVIPAPGGFPGRYFPYQGKRPGYGRREVVPPPNRTLPPPAQPFLRFWSTQTNPYPATLDPPAYPPPVIVAPEIKNPEIMRPEIKRR